MRIRILTGNDAFQDGNLDRELARILRELADAIEQGERPETARDINGSTVCAIDYEGR